jgi:hypothetical protein
MGSLVLGPQHGKRDVDLRTSALLGTPSAQSVHYYFSFALKDGGRLTPIATQLFDRMAILAATRRFLDIGAVSSRSLRSDMNIRIRHFVCRYTFVSFRRFGGDVRREIMQRLFVFRHGTLGSYLRDALQEGVTDVVAYLYVPRG